MCVCMSSCVWVCVCMYVCEETFEEFGDERIKIEETVKDHFLNLFTSFFPF